MRNGLTSPIGHSRSRYPIRARPRLRVRGDRESLADRCVQQPQTRDRAFCEDEHFSGVQNHHLTGSSKPFRATVQLETRRLPNNWECSG